MNNEKSAVNILSRDDLPISIEPDIHLSHAQQSHLDACLLHLSHLCHVPLILTCSLSSFSSIGSTLIDNEPIRINHYLRVRQPRKLYWMRNIREMRLTLQWPTSTNEQLRVNLVELHSCKRLPHSARAVIHPIKPIVLVYSVDERHLKVKMRSENSYLELRLADEKQSHKGTYYKWSDEGHIRSTTIQFDVDMAIERDWKEILLDEDLNLINEA